MCNCQKSLSDDNTTKCEALSAALKASAKVNPSTGKTEFSLKAWNEITANCPEVVMFMAGNVPPTYNDIHTGNIVVKKDNGDIVVYGHQTPLSQAIGIASGIAGGVYIYKRRKGKNKGKKVMPVFAGLLISGVVSEAVGYGISKIKK